MIFLQVLLIGMGVCLIIGLWPDITSEIFELNLRTGIAKHGFAYPTPRVISLDPKEMESYVDPTVQLMGEVHQSNSPHSIYNLIIQDL